MLCSSLGKFLFFKNSTEYSLKPGVRCMLSSSGICRRLLALLCVCVWTSFMFYIPRCVFLLTVKPLFSCISNTDADSLRMCTWPVLITSSLTLFTPLSPFPKQFMPVIFTLPVSQALPLFPVLTSAFLSACIQSVNCHTGSWYHRPPYLAVGEKTMMMSLWVSDWVWDNRYI